MKRLLLILLLCTGLAGLLPAATTIATTPASQQAADGGRFLFVVNTSSSMRRIEPATRQAVFDMIFTGLNGHMRSGDTFGLWTFNDQTHAGEFPMQVWDAQNPMETAARAAAHLSEQKYSGEPDTSVLLPKLQSVIGAVRDVTIFIVVDAYTKFEDTVYDDVVNTAIQQLAREQARLKKPFVATIVARGGKVTGAFVTIAGQPYSLPERPAPVLVKKPVPTARATNSAIAAATPAPVSPRAKIIEIVAKTNVPMPVVESYAPAPASVATPIVAPPQLVTTVEPITPPAPAPAAAILETNTNTIPAPIVAKVEPPPANPMPAPAPAVEPPATPKPVPPALAALMPRPQMAVSARELTPQSIEPQVSVEPLDPAVQTMQAIAVAPQAGLSPMVLLIIGGLLLASALFLIAVVMRRMRPVPQPSYITRSMDRR